MATAELTPVEPQPQALPPKAVGRSLPPNEQRRVDKRIDRLIWERGEAQRRAQRAEEKLTSIEQRLTRLEEQAYTQGEVVELEKMLGRALAVIEKQREKLQEKKIR